MDTAFTAWASAFFALSLTLPVTMSGMEYLSRPTWHRATTFTALMLVLLGYASSAFLGSHLNDHRAYLVAFLTSTFGACWLILASIMNWWRLRCRLQTEQQQTAWIYKLSRRSFTLSLGLVQVFALAYFVTAAVYINRLHSDAPIQGFQGMKARLANEQRSTGSLYAGYVMQTFLLAGVSASLALLWRSIPTRPVQLQVATGEQGQHPTQESLIQRAYACNCLSVLCILVRTVYHLVGFYMVGSAGLEIGVISRLGLYLDLLPLFCACWTVFAQSTILNKVDDLAIAQPGWPGNEKQGSVC